MTPPDPAVRSIRIATTLNERFRDLMHQRSSPGDGTAELELRIGEAQQIFPEIWNHLDDARKVIAERGGDTAAYDTIKASQGPARLGVTRVEVEDHHSVGLRIIEYRAKLAANPCDKPALEQLSRDLSRETPAGQDSVAHTEYSELCENKILKLKLDLTFDPCNGAKLAELVAALRNKGKSGQPTTKFFRDACASSKSGPPAAPP